MPQSGHRDQHAGRHAGGRQPEWTRKRIRHVMAGAMVMWATWAVAAVISAIIFHRGLFPIYSFSGFTTTLVSMLLATTGLGLIAIVAGLIWTARRQRR